jgi:hypothetical protein
VSLRFHSSHRRRARLHPEGRFSCHGALFLPACTPFRSFLLPNSPFFHDMFSSSALSASFWPRPGGSPACPTRFPAFFILPICIALARPAPRTFMSSPLVNAEGDEAVLVEEGEVGKPPKGSGARSPPSLSSSSFPCVGPDGRIKASSNTASCSCTFMCARLSIPTSVVAMKMNVRGGVSALITYEQTALAYRASATLLRTHAPSL